MYLKYHIFLGKIEGVYNVGQRTGKNDEENKITKKNNPSSANSSDYDKTGGQSSSNVDSGRGSAAYSSGRRPGGFDGEQYDSGLLSRGNIYRDSRRSKIFYELKLWKCNKAPFQVKIQNGLT